jgi:hypothetical protein
MHEFNNITEIVRRSDADNSLRQQFWAISSRLLQHFVKQEPIEELAKDLPEQDVIEVPPQEP